MAITVIPLDATSGVPAFTSQQTRQAWSALYGPAPSGRPLGAISGVRPGTPTTTVFLSGTGSMTWNVAAHGGVLDTQTSALAGPYGYATTGGDSGAITAADPSNPRVDIVYVKVNDNTQDGSGLTNGQVAYLAGTPAPSPTAPAVPSRGMVLANISVPASGGGAPSVSWVAPTFGVQQIPHIVRYRNAAYNIPNGSSFSPMPWDTDDQVDTTNFTTSSGDTTIRKAGVYVVALNVGFTGNATGRRGVTISVNGTAYKNVAIDTPGANTMNLAVTLTRRLAVNDIVRGEAFQTSGAALAARTGQAESAISISWMGY